jgi:hypothetical protein
MKAANVDAGTLRRLFVAAISVLALAVHAQPAAAPASCGQFVGSWSGTWSQGFYGTQWIHVTGVSPDCIAQLTYNPTGADVPPWTHPVAIRDGVIEFTCNSAQDGTCRLEVVNAELRVRYSDRTGFVNLGVFRKNSLN